MRKKKFKMREKCKNRNKSITNYRILVLFLIYTSVYSFDISTIFAILLVVNIFILFSILLLLI